MTLQNNISVEHLGKKYSNFHLSDISFTVKPGQIVGLIGENGAGKTTLISLLLNQIQRDTGEVKYGEEDIMDAKAEIKNQIGIVQDDIFFYDKLNAQDINRILKRIYTNWSLKIYNSFLKKFNLPIDKPICNYSKGMKTKLLLSTALCHQAKYLILDEVTSGLDPVVRHEVMTMLREYANRGNSVFFSTHITSDLEGFSDKVIFLHHGKIIFDEFTENLNTKQMIIECSEEEMQSIPAQFLESTLKVGNKYHALITSDFPKEQYHFPIKIASLDDIMLMYIKGENE